MCIRDRFGVGRVFLAGDAAHLFAPTGGMGMNTAFAGARNLAWKLAYVLKQHAPKSILDTYHSEWKPQALWRSEVALENHDHITRVYRAHFSGGDLESALSRFQQYTDYPGAIFGYEIESDLIQQDSNPVPRVDNRIRQHIPVVRSGRRLPHIWLDKAQTESVFDYCGVEYSVLLGPEVTDEWRQQIEQMAASKWPVRCVTLTACLLYTSPSPRDATLSRMPSSA